MKIAFNPSTVAALTSPPDNKDITFDLAGRNIFVRGVKFFGTDTQVNIIDNLNSSDSKSALSANMGRHLNLTKTPYNNTSTPSSAPSAYNIEICPTSSSWYSSLGIPDGGGGLLIRGHTGTAFNLWLHDTSNVWYKQTASGAWKKMDAGYADYAGYLIDNGTHSETASGTTANAANAGMLYGSGMYMTRTYNDSSMPTSYGNVINVAGGGSGQLLLGWSGSDSTTGNIYYRSHRDIATGGWGSWVTLLATNNYAGILDSRYYTESEVNNLLSKKLDRVNLTTGSWNPRGYNLAADYHYNGGDVSFAESGGQMHISIDGKFWQNEGQYRVLDTSDLSGVYNTLTINQYLSTTDTTWWPLIWGGSSHNNTNNSTGAVYKSYSALTWQTSSQTLYATMMRTNRLDVNGTPSSTSYRVADIAEFRSNYSSGIGWSVALKNTYHTSSSTGFGVGLKLALGADSETFKWVGIAAVSTSAWENAQDMLFYTNTTEKMRLTSNGYVGIGESNPLHKLHVGGDAAFENTIYLPSTGSSYIANGGNDSSGADFNSANIVIRSWWGISFKSYDDVIRTYLDTRTGNLGTKGVIYATHFYEYSDRTLKKNIKSIKSITNIPKLREFNWKDTGKRSYGFIAQELEDQGYACLVNEVNGKKTVNYTAALTLTMAKLQNLINVQNKKISNLTKELKSLKYGRKKNS